MNDFEKFKKRAIERKLLFRNGRKNEGDFFTYRFKDQVVSGRFHTIYVLDLVWLAKKEFPLSNIPEKFLNLTAPEKEAYCSKNKIVWREIEKKKKKKNFSRRISLLEYLIKKEKDFRDEHRFILDYL